jgi:glycosyltransferase involved in cell wall biosynthesis
MPKLLFVVTEDWFFVSHRLPLAVAARGAGFEVAVATRCASHCAAIQEAGVTVIPFGMDRRGLNPLGVLREALALSALLRRERPDLVHLVALRPVVVGQIAARMAGISRVVSAITGMGFLFTAQNRMNWARRSLEWALPRLLSRGLTIVQNDEDARQLEALGVVSSRLRLIPGAGVDTVRFSPTPATAGAPIVMLASRLLWDKGVGEFVEAARQLAEIGARFVLVGAVDDDNPAAISRAQLEQWVGEGVVEWWGYRTDMAATLGKASIVCLPSYREGLPKVLLEAMACGKPCITTDAPGCRDAVRHGDNGLLVPVRDAEALATAIRRLLERSEERARMGARGRERAVSEFSQEKVIAATLAVYREVLA